MFILLEQDAAVKLDILPSYELANKPSDQTVDAVCIGWFVVRIRFPFPNVRVMSMMLPNLLSNAFSKAFAEREQGFLEVLVDAKRFSISPHN